MDDNSKSYITPFQLNEPMNGHIVGKVTESNADGFNKGDIVTGTFPWQKVVNVKAKCIMLRKRISLYIYI